MAVCINSAALDGIDAIIIDIETRITPGLQYFIVGLPDESVKESLVRVESAITAAIPVKTTSSIATPEAIQLNHVCSGSLITVNKKFSPGCNPEASACSIFTHRCSYAAGIK